MVTDCGLSFDFLFLMDEVLRYLLFIFNLIVQKA